MSTRMKTFSPFLDLVMRSLSTKVMKTHGIDIIYK